MPQYPFPDRNNKCPDNFESVQKNYETVCRFPCGTLGRDQSTGECHGWAKFVLFFLVILILVPMMDFEK